MHLLIMSFLYIISTSLSISIVSGVLILRNIRLDHLYVCRLVCLSVRKMYWGKMADWIQMPFEVVSWVGQRIVVLVGGRDHRREGVNLGCPIVTNRAFVA